MPQIGYALSSEEHTAPDLVRYAKRAEDAGFPFALISDHFHPWIDRQGQSPFVWSVIGGIASVTKKLRLGTAVTCPTIRIHPAIIAQAAATAETMMPGRFFLGVGSGENLNEHIFGDPWPEVDVRLEMLEEALDVIHLLWEGGNKSHHGQYYDVQNARIYSLPEDPPPIMVAASGESAATLAGRLGDGLIGVAPDEDVVQTFRGSGGKGKPLYGQVTVCWAEDEKTARKTAHEWWPNAGLAGDLNQELPLPRHFGQASEMVGEDDIAEAIACGPDPDVHLKMIQSFADAGYDHIYVHQVGPDQDGFFGFYQREILPRFA